MKRLLVLLTLAGCTEPATQVLVVVHKYGITVGPGADVDELRLTVKSSPSLPDDDHVFQISNLLCGDVSPEACWQMPVTTTLVPGPEQPNDLVVVKVEGLRDSKRVIGDQASLHFLKDVSQRLDFVLYANCLNVDCTAQDKACNFAGMCQELGPTTFNGEPQLDGPPSYLLPDLLGADFVPPPDLGSGDLTVLRDLTPTTGQDLSMLPDLSTLQDLSALQDLSTLHDLAHADLTASDMTITDMTVSDMTITDMTISDMTVVDMSMADMTITDDMSMSLWTNITPSNPPVTNFKAVWGFGSEVFVVGGSAVIEHSTDGGDNWHLDVVVGLGDNLNAVWGDAGGTNVFAAGDHGALLRHQPNDTWASDTTVFTAPVQKDLHGLWADPSSDFFVVGAGFTLGTWNGTSWTELCGASNNIDSFQAISAFDSFSFFVAVNNGGAGEIRALQQSMCSLIDGDDGGADMTCSSGCPLHSIYGPTGNAFFGVSAFNGGGYAVGHLGTIVDCTTLGCAPMVNSNKQDLFGAWSEPDNSRNFAVGGNGTILFHSPAATGWSPETSNTAQQLNGVWGISGGGTVYAVGNGATILRRN